MKIVIEDNGRGIPSERIALVGKDGATFEKVNGHGLDLRMRREAWNVGCPAHAFVRIRPGNPCSDPTPYGSPTGL